jgi:hypothetical protein
MANYLEGATGYQVLDASGNVIGGGTFPFDNPTALTGFTPAAGTPQAQVLGYTSAPNAQGLTASAANPLLTASVVDNAAGGTPASPSIWTDIFGGPGSARATGTGTGTAAGSGATVAGSGASTNWVADITKWIQGIGAGLQDWVTRGFLIIIGLVVAAIAVFYLLKKV